MQDCAENLENDTARIMSLKNHLVERICAEISHTTYNGDAERRICGNAHFTFFGVNGEDLIIKLDEYGIAASTGSPHAAVRTQKSISRSFGDGIFYTS